MHMTNEYLQEKVLNTYQLFIYLQLWDIKKLLNVCKKKVALLIEITLEK
jgi:hypothetical protein